MIVPSPVAAWARRAGALSAGILALALLAGGTACAADNSYSTRLPAGRFGTVTVYIPEAQPRSVAIFLSGDCGWQLGAIGMARALTALAAVGIRTGTRQYLCVL